MGRQFDDFVPVTGGFPLPAEYVRRDLAPLCDLKVESDLDLHLVRLLALHPEVEVEFRNQDLTALDDETKRALVKDLSDLLGIKPLRSRPK